MNKKNKKKKRSSTVIKPPSKTSNKQHLSRDEVRSINKKKLEKKRKARKRFMSALASLVVICAGIVLVLSLCFKIGTVEIIGENIYSDKMIIEQSGITVGNNLFRLSEKKISENLSVNLPYIKSVVVKRKLPDTVILEVTSTKEIAAIAGNGGFVLVDEDAKVLNENASMLRENVALITNVSIKSAKAGSTLVLKNQKKDEVLGKILPAIKSSGIELLTEINLEKVSDIKLKYDDRITIELGSLVNAETKLARAAKAIEKENEINAYSKGTLDLKTEPYAYFNAGEEETKPAKKKQKNS